MNKRDITLKIAAYLLLCFCIFSCGKKNAKVNDNLSIPVTERDITSLAESYADSLLTNLTLEERIGQCLMPSLNASIDSSTLELYKKYIEDYHVGGIVLFQGDLSSAKKLASLGEESKVPLFIAIDAEWGLGMRLSDAPVYPKNGNIKDGKEDWELFDYGREIAAQSKEIGINMILGPVIDVVSENGGVIGKRSFGNNPSRVSEYGVAYAKGIESGGVISVAKHFPGHGSTLIDSHNKVAVINRDISLLDSTDLKPFRDYINSGLTGIMAGHIQAPALDPDGTAASVSMDMLSSLLREEMGFKGLILTDAFNMGGAKDFSAADAISAGADIILCPSNVETEYNNLMKSVKSGVIDISLINSRCRRILFIKYLFLIKQTDY